MTSFLSNHLPNTYPYLTKRIVFIYLLLYGAAAYFSVGYNHPDEHYQILEFAACKLDLDCFKAWEFDAEIRSTLQPTVVYWLYRFFGFFAFDDAANPFGIAFALRILSLLLSTLALLVLTEVFLGGRKLKHTPDVFRRWLVWFSVWIWFFPYLSVRFSSENFSRIFFILALSLPLISFNKNTYLDRQKKMYAQLPIGVFFGCGVLAGLSFLFRFQSAFMIMGLMIWLFLVRKQKFYLMCFMSLSGLAVTFGGFLLDSWFYGHWVFTPWNYFKANIIDGIAAQFGVSPWYGYFTLLWNKTSTLFPLMAIPPLIFFFFNPRHPITWVCVPFLLLHFYTGHKELRFLFPLVSFIPFFLVTSMLLIRGKLRFLSHYMKNRYARFLFKLLIIINFLLLLDYGGILRPAKNDEYFFRFLYNNYPNSIVFYFHPTDKNYFKASARGMEFYKNKNTIFIRSVMNDTDQFLAKYQKLIESKPKYNGKPAEYFGIILVSTSPLVEQSLDKEKETVPVLSTEWAGQKKIPLPKLIYTLPHRKYDLELIRSLIGIKRKTPDLYVYKWAPP